jgi:hypothetical protein
MLKATEDGAAALYYNGTSRIQTTNTGTNVTGVHVDDGATHDGDVTFTGANYNVTWDKSADDLIFADNAQAHFGTGSDLKIYHDASNSYIQHDGTGNLIIYGSGETLATFADDGAVSLYYNGGKTLETTANGVTIYDDGKNDEGRLIVQGGEGSAATLYLYSDDGDDNADKWRLLNENTGEFKIQNYASGSWETNFKGIADGASVLYHNNTSKLDTTSVGVNITGNVDCDSLNNAGISTLSTTTFTGDVTFDGATAGRDIVFDRSDNALELADSAELILGTGGDTQVYHDGSNSFVNHNGTGALCVRGNDLRLQAVDGVSYVRGYSSDDRVELYYGNAVKLASASGGVTITGTATATAFAGDGSALTGLAAGGGEFNTSISEYATVSALTTSMATAFTANSSSSHRTIVHSCRITNKSSSEVTVSGELYGSSKFAYLIPVPAGSSVELFKKPKVLGASDTLELQASSGSALDAVISAERQENTDLVASSLESTDTSANTLATMGAAAVVESILCVNDDGTNDVKATVTWTNSSGTVQAYLSYELIIPAGASVELLERPLAMPSGHKLRVTANQANRLVTISAHKVAS